jgi:hypothetical protein
MTEPLTNWLEEEEEKLTKNVDYEKLPALKLTPNVITEMLIDFSAPFKEWVGEDAKGMPVKKKIIPVTVAGVKMNFWLNVKNPLYTDIIKAAKTGQVTFKVLQTGTQQNTKYVLVK